MNTNSSSKILIAVATYNEMENLPDLVEAIFHFVPQADLLVVDDQSADGTGQWALQKSRECPQLKVMIRTQERGLGTAVLAALSFAMEHHYDFVVNLDADFSHPVDRILPLIRCCEGEGTRTETPENMSTTKTTTGTAAVKCRGKRRDSSEGAGPVDVAIGSRYVTGGAVVGWPWTRRWMSCGVNRYARLLLGLKTRDNSGAFRCYRVSFLKRVPLSRIQSRGYSFFEEILFRLKQEGATFKEIPITFTDRVRGSSKINHREAFNALWILFKLGLSRLKIW